jgi:hypothetical protein
MCDTVRSLLAMSASPCLDIKLQGVMALADLSCTPAFEDAIKNCDFNVHDVLAKEGCCKVHT